MSDNENSVVKPPRVSETPLLLSNVFIEGLLRGKLQASDKKILNLIAHKVLMTDGDSNEVEITMNEMLDAGVVAETNKRGYADILGMLKRIANLAFVYNNVEIEHFLFFRFASEIEYKKGVARLVITPSMIKIFNAMGNGYTKILLENIKSLRSFYSVRLYELLRQYLNIGWRRFTVEELRRTLNCEHKHKVYDNFRKHVLKRALKEINEKTDIRIACQEKRIRWKIREITFLIQRRDADSGDKTSQPTLPGDFERMEQEMERFELDVRRAGWVGGDFAKFIASHGGYDKCKRFWDDILKGEVLRQRVSGKLNNIGGFIDWAMHGAAKYVMSQEEKTKSSWDRAVEDFKKRIPSLSDEELSRVIEQLPTTQRYRLSDIPIDVVREMILQTPGLYMDMYDLLLHIS